MFNETALSWALVNKWLDKRGNFYDITRVYDGYCVRFKGDPNRVFEGKTILDALKNAMNALG